VGEKTYTVGETNGTLVTKARNVPQTYAYSLRNQLVSHNTNLQYSYDAFGRRVRSRKGGGLPIRIVKHYLLPDGRPYLDRPTGPKPTPPEWSYAYLGDRLLARFDNKGNVEHVVTDHIGYPMATISYTGTILWQPDPEPFGDVYAEQQVGPGHDPLIRYPGQWRLDPVLATTEPTFTTLYYNTYRWYNPSWGRYTQADPLGILGGINAFEYAGGGPQTFIDRLGLDYTPNTSGRFYSCDALLPRDPPQCGCSSSAVRRHAENARNGARIYCREVERGSGQPPDETVQAGSRGNGDHRIGRYGAIGGAEYRPQGDKCVDFCICVHEWTHEMDTRNPAYNRLPGGGVYGQWFRNETECNAYRAQTACLAGAFND